MIPNDKTVYYFIRLPRDWFERARQKVVLGMKDGWAILAYYIRIVCESANRGGVLRLSPEKAYNPITLGNALGEYDKTFIRRANKTLVAFSYIKWDAETGDLIVLGAEEMISRITGAGLRMRESRGQESSKTPISNQNEQENDVGRTKGEQCSQSVLPIVPSLHSSSLPDNRDNGITEIDSVVVSVGKPTPTPTPSSSTPQRKADEEDDDPGSKDIRNQVNGTAEEKASRFFEAYPKPKRINKGSVAKWFASHMDCDFALIMSALEKQKRSDNWKKQGGRYVPFPAKWLEDSRWLDEAPADGQGEAVEGEDGAEGSDSSHEIHCNGIRPPKMPTDEEVDEALADIYEKDKLTPRQRNWAGETVSRSLSGNDNMEMLIALASSAKWDEKLAEQLKSLGSSDWLIEQVKDIRTEAGKEQ